jgi:hypothetical protein
MKKRKRKKGNNMKGGLGLWKGENKKGKPPVYH